jgi:exonuclease SbcD
MSKPIAIIFNDAHLKTGNEQDVIHSVRHMLTYAKAEGIDKLIFAGDLFDSRSFQRQSVLQAFDEMLELINKAGCTLYIFPGNHDKTVYASYDSFLDVYRHYPGVVFNRELSVIDIDGITITLLPFFSDDMLIPMLEEAEGTDVLISHFEMAGSTHLGKTSEKSTINKELLSKWKKTYLGHYHNHHEITENIVHLPSLRQTNFGEDDYKGFSILHDDLSYKIIEGNFKRFKKVTININVTSAADISQLIKTYENSSDTIRFEFVGDESKLKALDKSQFNNSGIDVKIKYDVKYDYADDQLTLPTVVEHYGEDQVRDAFKVFCDDKGYEYQDGIVLLNEFLTNK